MVRRLVHEQRAAVLPQAMPTPEVVSAVVNVEIPGEVHRLDVPNRFRREHLLDGLMLGGETIVEADGDLPAVAFLGVEDRAALLLVRHHRFLGDHIDAAIERAYDVAGVRRIHRGNREQVGLHLVTHRVEVGEDGPVELEPLLHLRHSLAIHIAESDEFDGVSVIRKHVSAPHRAPAPTSADNRVAATCRASGRDHRAADRRHSDRHCRGCPRCQEISPSERS